MIQPQLHPRRFGTLLALALGACSGGSGGDANDATKPAVVEGPKVVLVSDTSGPDTTDATELRMKAAQVEIVSSYSVLSVAVVTGDARMVGSVYAPDASLRLPDSTYAGLQPVTKGWFDLRDRVSMVEIRRSPVYIAFLRDSMVADSGVYELVSKARSGATSAVRGRYSSLWRQHPPPIGLVLKSDRIYPGAPRPK